MRVTVGQRKGEKLGNDGGMITRNDADPGKGREKHYPLVLLKCCIKVYPQVRILGLQFYLP